MKKLIALLLILVFSLTGCEYLDTLTAQSGDTTQDSTPTNDVTCTHTSVSIQGTKNATCSTPGYTGDKVCSLCGVTVLLGTEIPTINHIYTDGACYMCGKEESTGNPDTGNPDTGNPDTGNPDTGNPDTGNPDTGNPDTDNPNSCVSHKDQDDNGVCDVCKVSVLVWYEFYSVNDLHGKFADTDSQPGVDELTTYLKEAQSKGNAIILSSGDMWQGSSESNLTKGKIITEWMNYLGFVSMTIGNHEFDWTDTYIKENLAIAEFPLLAINIYSRSSGKRVEYCESSVIVDMGGLQIGIIGAIGDCYSSIAGASIGTDVYFKTGNELTELVKAEAIKLREQGADFIVYSIHSGGDYDEKLSNGYIDLVFEGHTHQSYTSYDTYGVAHIQGGGENKGISYAKVSINSVTGSTSVTSAKVIKSSTYSAYASDSIVDELLKKYEDEISKAYEVLGYNAKYRDDSEIEQLVAQLYYEYGVEKWGDKYDIVLAGGSINTRSPYNIYKGDVLYSHLQSILPFDNEITLCSIKGKDLLDKFINNSSYSVYYTIDPSTINPNSTYYVIADTWSSGYSYNKMTVIDSMGPNIFARDLVADYVRKGYWEK